MPNDTTPAPIGADALREALWICVEHNALHFGETHNTVVQGRAALASAAQPERVPLTDVQIDKYLPLGVAGYSAHQASKGGQALTKIDENQIVQAAPHIETFGGCMVVVTEVKEWGIQGYVQSAGVPGQQYIRLKTGDFEATGGRAVWVAQ